MRSTRRTLAAWDAALAARRPVAADGILVGAHPIALDAAAPAGRRRAVLVVHGFGDTPQSVAGLARALHADGWTVRVPLLPGHGRTVSAFAASTADAWRDAVAAAHAALAADHDLVAIVGQSMGGALGASLAATLGDRLPALVLLAPYLEAPPAVRWAARLAPLLALVLPVISSDGGARSIHDPAARAEALGPGVVTPGLVRELARVVARAQAALPHVAAPTLVVCSALDHRVPPQTVEAAYARLRAASKELVRLERCGHVLTVDHERERVFTLVREWLARHAGWTADAPAAPAEPEPVVPDER